VGSFAITAVLQGDYLLPPGWSCVSGFSKPPDGHKFLTVWLETADGSNPEDVGNKLFNASAGVYVTSADGSRVDRVGAGMIEGMLFITFTPRTSMSNFKLFWPGNPTIDLGK